MRHDSVFIKLNRAGESLILSRLGGADWETACLLGNLILQNRLG